MAPGEESDDAEDEQVETEERENEQPPRNPTDSQIFEYIDGFGQFISNQRQRPLLYIFYPSAGMIQSNHSVRLYQMFLDRGSVENLDVILHSTGGDLHEAYDIIKLCRNYTNGEVTVFVPMRAMSAATLIALGADKLAFSEIGKLGPLDPQIPHPEKGYYMPVRSVTEIPEVLEKGLASSGNDVPIEVKGEAIIKPIAEQVDPYYLTEHEKTADLAREYGQKLLTQRDFNETHAQRCLDYLIEYPTHSYSVDLHEINSTPDLNQIINAVSVKSLENGGELERNLILMLNFFLHFDQKYIMKGEPRAEPRIEFIDPMEQDQIQQMLGEVEQEDGSEHQQQSEEGEDGLENSQEGDS